MKHKRVTGLDNNSRHHLQASREAPELPWQSWRYIGEALQDVITIYFGNRGGMQTRVGKKQEDGKIQDDQELGDEQTNWN